MFFMFVVIYFELCWFIDENRKSMVLADSCMKLDGFSCFMLIYVELSILIYVDLCMSIDGFSQQLREIQRFSCFVLIYFELCWFIDENRKEMALANNCMKFMDF